jgi:hypothetical protein
LNKIWGKIWYVLSWSPIKGKPWHYHWFNLLWSVFLFMVLLGWNDNIIYFNQQGTEDNFGPEQELPDSAWNVPLDLGNGTCLDVVTREITLC